MPIQTRLFLNYNLGLTHRHMAKMTKSQIMSELAAKTGLSKKDTNMFVETLVNMALTQVKKNGEFVIPGIGKLVKVKRPARVGRNPATGESIKIAAKTVVKFRVAKAAKDSVL
jgi:DNA-binding protein HU-beta